VAAQFLKQILSTNALRKRVAKMTKTPEQQHAALIVFVGRLLAVCFTFTVFAFIYGVLFVDQPEKQAPTDAQLIDLLSTLLVFLTGTLSGLVASNGLKSKTPQLDQ
jgi:hypothetical protein